MVTPARHNARAAGAVVLAMAAITASDALVKGLLEEIKPSQFIFVRALVILLILGVALVLNNQRIPLPSLRQPWSLVRGGCELLSTSLWLFGLQFIALPTAAALAWTSPIMVTLLGIVILREANSLWRWVSVLIGFIGVLCVTRPWGTEWSLLLLLPVATSTQVFHRQSCKRESQTPGEFVAGAHHPGVLTVTDQDLITLVERQSPERQHATGGDVFAEGQSMGRDSTDSSELAARAVDLLADVRPDLCCEGTQFLDAFPAGCDRLKGRCG